ncbi:MAG: hypothetical protein R6V32_07430 [Bacteroidales bacterium]
MKRIIIFPLFLLSIIVASAQTVILSEDDPERVYEETDWGPNKQHFGYWFVNYGVPVPVTTDNNLKISSSGHCNVGYAYKIKMFSFMDIAAELSYSNYFYALDEDARDSIDSGRSWDKIRTKQNGLKAAMYFRFYFNPSRGNYFGTYIDVGVYGDYHMGSGWLYKFKEDGFKEEISYRRDADFETFTYGPAFAFGRDQFVAFAQYNLNSVLSGNKNFPEMPRCIFGLQMNLYSAF